MDVGWMFVHHILTKDTSREKNREKAGAIWLICEVWLKPKILSIIFKANFMALRRTPVAISRKNNEG